MSTAPLTYSKTSAKPAYGWDAPYVSRNLLLAVVACSAVALLTPRVWHVGSIVFLPRPMLFGTAVCCAAEFLLFLHYVKRGKFLHRDAILGLHSWRGDETVLDVGCGRGLLLVGAAKRAPGGFATGLDIWSNDDLSGNAASATEQNLILEGVAGRCTLVSEGAQRMPFAEASFDVVVSNLCLHNIYDRPTWQQAVAEIARVLRPGGQALLSGYRRTV